MSTILQNSIWPNPDGNLGKNKTAIPDGVNVKWPEGDALIHNFVYKDGKLVGFVDTKALIVNDDKNTIIPYECVNINLDNILEDTMTIVQGERCKYLTTAYADVIEFLTPKLKELLDETKFELYFEKDAKKLIVHTDRIADDMIASLENLLERVLPQNIEVVHTNYFLPDGYKELEYLEKEKQCVLNVPYTPEESLYVRLKYMTYLNDKGQVIMSGTSTTKDKLASIQEGFSRLNVRINNIANNFALDASQPCEHTYWPHRNLVKIGDTVSELTNKLTGTLSGEIMTFFGDYTDKYALKGRVYNVEIGNDSGKVKNLIPCVDNVGAPCFFDIVEYQTYYHSGRLDFIIPGQEYAIQTLDLDLEAKSYAQLTEHGVRRLYHVPKGCNMTKDEYAAANGFKEIVEPPMPQTGYWRPEWRETETQIVLDWIETEEPMEVNENE